MFSLKGKTALVTGGGRGIGRGITLAMARAGANVVIAGRTREWLETAAAEARTLGAKTLTVQCDITEDADLRRLVQESLQTFGYVDCWVNNAGNAAVSDFGRLIDLDRGQWDRVVDLNFKATFFACQAAARAMTRGGSIINITSRSAAHPTPITAHYGASKAGLEGLTKSMALEWGHLGIRVNAVSPGTIEIERTENTPSSRRQRQLELIAMRRVGRVDDIGAACAYLATDEASYLSGVIIPVDGGSEISSGYLSYLWRVNQEVEAREAAGEAPGS